MKVHAIMRTLLCNKSNNTLHISSYPSCIDLGSNNLGWYWCYRPNNTASYLFCNPNHSHLSEGFIDFQFAEADKIWECLTVFHSWEIIITCCTSDTTDNKKIVGLFLWIFLHVEMYLSNAWDLMSISNTWR